MPLGPLGLPPARPRGPDISSACAGVTRQLLVVGMPGLDHPAEPESAHRLADRHRRQIAGHVVGWRNAKRRLTGTNRVYFLRAKRKCFADAIDQKICDARIKVGSLAFLDDPDRIRHR